MRKHTFEILLIYLLLIILIMVTFSPFYWMIMSSFKEKGKIFTTEFTPVPSPPILKHYFQLITKTRFLRWMFNSILITTLSTVIGVALSSLGGFAFAVYDFYGKKILFTIVIASIAIPRFVVVIPVYNLMMSLGLIDTYWALVLPFSVNALAIFLVRQYIKALPMELIDSARIDGCSEFKVFYKIVLPLSKPVLGAAGILIFLESWNNFIWPLIMMQSPEMYTFTVGLSSLSSLYRIEYGMIMAGSFLSTLPILIFFLTRQKQFMAGLTSGAIKG